MVCQSCATPANYDNLKVCKNCRHNKKTLPDGVTAADFDVSSTLAMEAAPSAPRVSKKRIACAGSPPKEMDSKRINFSHRRPDRFWQHQDPWCK
eukprot:12364305-Karenia_brevis.AAC.1